MGKLIAVSSALLIIDVQKAFDEWALTLNRNNPDAEATIARMLAAFRKVGGNVVHVRHAGTLPKSLFRPGLPGFEVRDEAREVASETVIVKNANSAFIGTDLDRHLRERNIQTLVIVGATTNHCVETTTRMAGNLGYDTKLVRDATWTFDRTGPDGDKHSADEIHAMSLSNLNGEFAEILTSADVLARIQ